MLIVVVALRCPYFLPCDLGADPKKKNRGKESSVHEKISSSETNCKG